ncbi:Fic family protein [Endozoicomonas sp. SM1973]|uniref:Fic family protein n=1 Tax=Spartinivicinus marinus TaxID=2994442 RepID=A0A853I6U1_9GAMM|nr:Fic family protein [Spartinivicinus marinus]NYZ69630.1 Fic family protein [Spartinivicinus marinus]
MKSLITDYLNKIHLSLEQTAALRAIGEYKGKQILYAHQKPDVLNSMQKVALVESSESSNRLEGIIVSTERVRDLVLHDSTPCDRSEQEVAGYRDALELIHESAQYMPFSCNVICQLHNLIYRYLPQDGGRWKSMDNDIVEKSPDGRILRVRFQTVSVVETPAAMEQLELNYKDVINRYDALVIIPLVILDFLCIHPFSDGNGRSARLLTLLLLYQAGYEVGKFISLERVFEDTKDDYYATLERSSQHWHQGLHDPIPWLNYFWGVMIRAYKEFEARVDQVNINTSKGTKSQMVRAYILNQIKPFAISDIANNLPGVSHETIRNVIRELKSVGAIQLQGKGRGAKWYRV